MSLTLVATSGASNANAYATLASANNFLEQNIHITAWASLSTANAEACIIYATTLLDYQIDWLGYKTNDADQHLDWPREGMYDSNSDTIDDDTIPVFLQEATSFYAYFLSQDDRTTDQDTFGFKKLKAGSLFMEIDKYDRRPTIPNTVWDMLKQYGTKAIALPRTLERK